MKLEKDFYLRKDVVQISKELIGKVIHRMHEGQVLSGIICETEAYNGTIDKASHAYGGRRNARTETMYQEGGLSYVYLCYGIHKLFNVITNKQDIPHAVLIRGIVPLEGKEQQVKNRGQKRFKQSDFLGPGKVTQALKIEMSENQQSLFGTEIWIEDQGIKVLSDQIISGPRVGVDYAGEDALLPYRFQYFNF